MIGIFFGAVLFVGIYDEGQETQIEKERLDREGQEKIEMDKIKAERERIETEELEEQRSEAERLGNLKTPEQNLQKTAACDDFKEGLTQMYEIASRYNQVCESVQYGSYGDFLIFSEEMHLFENTLHHIGTTPKKANEQTWKIIDTAKNECPQLKAKANDVQLQFSLMGLCFESVYEMFGEFPAMWFGMSPDYFEHNPAHTANGDQCVLFCDSYGHEPQWAKSMGVYKAASKCTTILNDWESSDPDDQSWCTEFAEYLITG